MWPYKTVVYFGLFWFGCLASLVNPIWGVANYMLAYQVHPPVHWWGYPLTAIGMRFSWLAMLFIMLGLLFARRRTPKTRPAIALWEVGVGCLVALSVLNALLGIAFAEPARFALEKLWKLQVFVLILGRLAVTRVNLKIVFWAIVLGSLFLGYDAYTASPWRFAQGRLDFFGGPDVSTSSGASAHLAGMLPIIAIAFLTAKKWKWKLLAAASGAFTVNAIVLCRTRGAFIALLVGGLVAVVMAPRARRYRIHLCMLIGLLVTTTLTDTNYRDRMATMTSKEARNEDPAVLGRSAIWKASLEIIWDYPFGVGLGNFSTIIGHYDVRYWRRSAHSSIVACFVELGIPGGLLFLLIMFESIHLLYRSSRQAHLTDNPVETKLFAYGLLVSITTYIVAGLVTERFLCESFWWVLVFPLCLHRLVAGELRSRAEAPQLITPVEYPEQGEVIGRPGYAI